MKNVWKGLAVGAVVGAAVGMVNDGLARAGQKSAELGQVAIRNAEDAAGRAKAKVADAELGDKLREVATKAHDKLEDVAHDLSDTVGR